MRSTLSQGKDAWRERVPNVIPRNSREVLGLSVFSSERGTPSSEKTLVRVASPNFGGEDEGVIMRKNQKVKQIWQSMVVCKDPAQSL